MTIVEFKSIPEMFKKERDGRKPNTLRKIDETDERFKILRNGCDVIMILSTDGKGIFTRELTDYTEWDGYAIISWKHEGERR